MCGDFKMLMENEIKYRSILGQMFFEIHVVFHSMHFPWTFEDLFCTLFEYVYYTILCHIMMFLSMVAYLWWQSQKIIMELKNTYHLVTLYLSPQHGAMPYSCFCGEAGINKPNNQPVVKKCSAYNYVHHIGVIFDYDNNWLCHWFMNLPYCTLSWF